MNHNVVELKTLLEKKIHTEINYITPIDFKSQIKRGSLSVLEYGSFLTDKGYCLIGFLNERICYVGLHKNDLHCLVQDMQKDWSGLSIQENSDLLNRTLHELLTVEVPIIPLTMKGTVFQQKIWTNLQQIKRGHILSYSDFAESAGYRSGIRAVASAIGRNHICLFIPCHRIISKKGDFGHFRWGKELKRDMIHIETGRQSIINKETNLF